MIFCPINIKNCGNEFIFMCNKFEKFWKNYPQPYGKHRAFHEFRKLNPNEQLFDKILTSLKEQIENYREAVRIRV